MSTLEAYITELEADLKVDAFNIKDVQMRLPSIKHKWIGRYVRLKQQLIKLQSQRDAIKLASIDKVQKTAVVAMSTAAVDRLVESTKEIKEIDNQIRDSRLVLELLEKAEKVLSSMTFDIKNMISLQQLEQT